MTDTRVANARLVGKLLGLSGLFLLVVSLAAWMQWLPYAEGSQRTLAKVFLAAGTVDLIIAFVLTTRNP